VDIYGTDKLEAAYQAEATEFSSLLLVGNAEGSFDIQYLPREAQAFPIMDALIIDLNKDGLQDAIVAGCLYETEVETPRLDAGSGLVLLATGDGYQLAPCPEFCFHIPGNVKHLDLWDLEDGRQFIVALCNDAPLSMIRFQQPNM
jgi:hypothetical protein